MYIVVVLYKKCKVIATMEAKRLESKIVLHCIVIKAKEINAGKQIEHAVIVSMEPRHSDILVHEEGASLV